MFVSNFSERVHLLSLQSTRRVPFNRGYIQRVQWKSVSVKELQIGIFILILRMVLVTSLTVIMLKKCSYRWCNNKIEMCGAQSPNRLHPDQLLQSSFHQHPYHLRKNSSCHCWSAGRPTDVNLHLMNMYQ